ncbi:putative N-lysine methyltransferase SEE1 [Rosellinia necatrix]|uniref:Protein-lysine N-methyltransferase EFM4 n=1 Tax=Rosellinia necatrix TaxID=77044 RepID=A0A1W2TEG7_ROSNE|nr:putative N-lysine methyltransferase SEE1 [Rosellinia necatrix]
MTKPAHLEPSKLGTKEYWDALYSQELANHAHDPSDTGTAWFDDSDAEAKLLRFLGDPGTAAELGLSPDGDGDGDGGSGEGKGKRPTSFLDLGTGNGALLFSLRDAGWRGPMLGVDYSAQSVRFARRIERGRRRQGRGDNEEEEQEKDEEGEREEVDVHFAEHDILRGPAAALLDGARFSPAVVGGWDVVLDKGTFDAVSLSAATAPGAGTRASEGYGARVLPLVRPGGLFLITSCNWTEAELRGWFEDGASYSSHSPSPSSSASAPGGGGGGDGDGDGAENNDNGSGLTTTTTTTWGFEVVGRVEYRSFSFGGVKGQTISSLCFRKVERRHAQPVV